MSPRTPRRRHLFAASAVATAAVLAGCGDDDGTDEPPSTGSVMPGATGEVLDDTGGPGDTVLNNQPTSPAVNNVPPGDDGTG
jgi:hypothetical protein